MERVKALIAKLQEQLDQNNDVSAMMLTVQLLQAELQHAAQGERPQLGSAKVAVVLPSYNSSQAKLSTEVAPKSEEIKVEVEREQFIKESSVIVEKTQPTLVEKTQPAPPQPAPKKPDTSIQWVFDAVREIPTLAHQTDFKEINDVIAKNGNGATSLNDRLRSNGTELSDLIVDAPVRDLRKAIGINDRYVFVSELFRGDEVGYERSIKTINNFRILAEAQYWIERELKLKLGWDENKEIVKLFDQLVKRRFS
jgi:hypothetical protein